MDWTLYFQIFMMIFFLSFVYLLGKTMDDTDK